MLALTPQNQPAPSWYVATSNIRLNCPPLAGAIEADVCVVGGGYSGVNTAIELAERGLSVVLLEASQIGWGASGRNGGQLIRGVGHGLDQFTNVLGEQGVRELKLMGLEAVQLVKRRVEKHDIACDLTWGYADLANKPRHLDAFRADMEELRGLGYSAEMRILEAADVGQVVNSDFYAGAMTDMGSGHVHPLNLLLGEAAAAQQLGVQLFEQSQVTRIDYGPQVKVHTAHGTVTAGQLVLACNAYLRDL